MTPAEYKHNWYQANRVRLDAKTKKYNKSYNGKIICMYLNAKQRVLGQDKKRPSYKGLPICTMKQFKAFILRTNYRDLWAAWVKSGYRLVHTPTIDRLDKLKGYTLDNIEIVTYSENTKRRDRGCSNSIHREN